MSHRSVIDILDEIKAWIQNKKTGNVDFKGTVSIGGHDILVKTQINFFRGGISAINLNETIKLPKTKEVEIKLGK